MGRPAHSESDFFEAKYRDVSDPWAFESRPYELQRYDVIIEAIVGKRYRSAVEPGCSIGVLTARLGALCDEVFAFDFSETASEAARDRCKNMGHVRVQCGELSEAFDFSRFDLIVLSEIGYYFELSAWQLLVSRLTTQIESGATVVAAHWLGKSPDHELSGDQVHEALLASPRLHIEQSDRYSEFRLEKWIKR